MRVTTSLYADVVGDVSDGRDSDITLDLDRGGKGKEASSSSKDVSSGKAVSSAERVEDRVSESRVSC